MTILGSMMKRSIILNKKPTIISFESTSALFLTRNSTTLRLPYIDAK